MKQHLSIKENLLELFQEALPPQNSVSALKWVISGHVTLLPHGSSTVP